MIPTSTNVKIELSDSLPRDVEALAAMIHKEVGVEDANAALLPPAHREAVEELIKAKAVTGKSNEVTVQLLAGERPGWLIVIGLGDGKKFSAECLREAGGTLVKAARKLKVNRVAVVVPRLPEGLPGIPGAAAEGSAGAMAVEAIAEGFALGAFEFQEYKGTASKKENGKGNERPLHLTIVMEESAAAEGALKKAMAVSEGQNFARTIASRPGNTINPPALAEVAREMAREAGLGCRVLDEKQMAKLGMGGILAVGSGSSVTPPRMVVLEYEGRRQKTGERRQKNAEGPTLLIVGKAITFDTGGISIKPADRMGKMIFDKSGGMTVMGVMLALARLKWPIHVVGILSSAENHISETAYRPGDYLRMYNGVTVEVTNTDAEGRLVLGDALAWGIETYKPEAVVDLATLTGGVITALGKSMAGMMSNDDELVKELQRAADEAGEKVWRLPLGEEQKEQMKSEAADIVNSAGREGHPLQGGAFLSYFVPDDVPWAHLDIAGVADTDKDMPFYAKGATGWGVRTLVEWIERRASIR